MLYSRLSFPEIQLPVRAAHKLRGFFGEMFREHSPLLHNHYEDGSFRYAYPLVQYKVLEGVPTLLGLGEGAELLTQLFLKIDKLEIEDRSYPIRNKQLQNHEVAAGIDTELHAYRFATYWMALNQQNYARWRAADEAEQEALLRKLLTNHLVAFLRAVDALSEHPIMVLPKLQPRITHFKNQKMTAFAGSFVSNVVLPEAIGIGKSVSRGFGAVVSQQ